VLLEVIESDPQGSAALALLHEAALEARTLYPEFHDPSAPGPTNHPTPPRGVYFVAFASGRAVGMGAHRPLDERTTEVRRMFVTAAERSKGVARAVLKNIEEHARLQGFRRLVLETGNRQLPAIRLYESSAFIRIPPFGAYANDPTSVCLAKDL
jgi:GNAT superfamily N-acetyltransferase